MEIILVSGVSGSGKTMALKCLEDAQYYAVDNLLPTLLPLLVQRLHNVAKIAVAIDVRSTPDLQNLPDIINKLSATHKVHVLFLDASNTALQQRFSETRRRHPLTPVSHDFYHDTSPQSTLQEGIEEERRRLQPLIALAHVIDTSHLSAHQLREYVHAWRALPRQSFTLCFMSFGFKGGVPLEADFIFDVRHLPNPFYDPALRRLNGKDAAVIDFFHQQDLVQEGINDIVSFLQKWLQNIPRDGRSYCTVAVGCTGGQHRSVFVVENVASQFPQYAPLIVRHRDMH